MIPGGIDPHVHCSWPIVVPGRSGHQLTDPTSVVSRAALAALVIGYAAGCALRPIAVGGGHPRQSGQNVHSAPRYTADAANKTESTVRREVVRAKNVVCC